MGSPHYDVLFPGFKYNMMDLQAAIGLHQLAGLAARTARREAVWRIYDEGLADLPLGRPAPVPDGDVHARHLYSVLVGPETGLTRDALIAHLATLRHRDQRALPRAAPASVLPGALSPHARDVPRGRTRLRPDPLAAVRRRHDRRRGLDRRRRATACNSGTDALMPIIRHVAVVFRVAAGPRLGFGHLVRCRAIARALGVEPRVSIRGTAATRRAGASSACAS